MGTVVYTSVEGMILNENRGGTIRDYVGNDITSTVALLDSSQNQTDSWSYFPYGEATRLSGSTPTPLLFAGGIGYHNDNAQRTHVLTRPLEQGKARRLTQDAISIWSGDLNEYRYVGNDPVNETDRTGLSPDTCDNTGRSGIVAHLPKQPKSSGGGSQTLPPIIGSGSATTSTTVSLPGGTPVQGVSVGLPGFGGMIGGGLDPKNHFLCSGTWILGDPKGSGPSYKGQVQIGDGWNISIGGTGQVRKGVRFGAGCAFVPNGNKESFICFFTIVISTGGGQTVTVTLSPWSTSIGCSHDQGNPPTIYGPGPNSQGNIF